MLFHNQSQWEPEDASASGQDIIIRLQRLALFSVPEAGMNRQFSYYLLRRSASKICEPAKSPVSFLYTGRILITKISWKKD